MIWTLLGLGVFGAALLGGKRVIDAAAEKTDATGVCQTDPSSIAAAHGVALDVEALARMAVSEAGSKEAAQVAVMWAARNMAKRRGESVAALLLRGKLASDGKFGAQNTGKYASTRSPSTAQSRKLAAGVMAATIPDPTRGATQWDSPAAQNALTSAGVSGYTKTADQVAAERSKASSLVTVAGVTNIRFWAPKTGGVA